MKMSAYYENVGALPKCWRPSALLKCWRPIEMFAPFQNVGPLLKCWRAVEMLASYYNVGVLYNETCKNYNSCTSWLSPYCLAWQNSTVTTPPLLSLVALLSLVKVLICPHSVDECQLLRAGQLIWADCSCTGPLWSYWPDVCVLLKRWRTSQM